MLEVMLIRFAGGSAETVPTSNLQEAMGITANPHGIRNGWFNWPWNFDPVWLETCSGFSAKEAK
jgi:hypothetical protein